MTWHIEVVDADHLQVVLGTIRNGGGTITSSRPCIDGYCITYVTSTRELRATRQV